MQISIALSPELKPLHRKKAAGIYSLFHEPKVRELSTAAGFSSIRRLPVENPFNTVYEIRP
jgi:hypothetical protein